MLCGAFMKVMDNVGKHMTVKSYEGRGVSSRQFGCMFNSLFRFDKEHIKVPNSWSFVRGIHGRPVDSFTKGQKCGNCFHVITFAWWHLIMKWWRHPMETFSALLTLCEGNPPVTGGFPHKGQWRGALKFSLICAWTNDWANTRDAGDLRRHSTHYDVTALAMKVVRSLQSFDHTGTGYVSAAELRRMLTSMGEALTDEELDQMLNQMPADGDGMIRFDGEDKSHEHGLSQLETALHMPHLLIVWDRYNLRASYSVRALEFGLSQWDKTLHMWCLLSLAETMLILPERKEGNVSQNDDKKSLDVFLLNWPSGRRKRQ